MNNPSFQLSQNDRPPQLLKVPEAAEFLNVGLSTVYQFIRTGELKCVRMGRSVRIDPVDLADFIADRKHQPHAYS